MSDLQTFIDEYTAKVTREVDAGEFAARYAGKKFTVWVNAPKVVETLYGGRGMTVIETTDEHGQLSTQTHYAPQTPEEEYRRMRSAVAILFELELNQVRKLDDTALLWFYNKGWDLYVTYHAELRTNLPSASPPA